MSFNLFKTKYFDNVDVSFKYVLSEYKIEPF